MASSPLLVGCQTVGEKTAERPAADQKEVVDRVPRALATKGVELLRDGEYEKAGVVFNSALKLDITNSYLQFLNGLTYHLRAIQGDSSLYPMAQEGYELAVKFDRTNWLAHYHLGLLHLDRRDFAAAKESFSEAVLLKSGDRDGLYNLALAAYYDHDPVTADGALRRLRAIVPEDGRVLRASALVAAALGDDAGAKHFLDTGERAGDLRNAAYVAERVDEWKSFHDFRQVERAPLGGPDRGLMQLAQAEGDADEEDFDEEEAEAEDDPNKMVIVDVVIIRTEEDLSSSAGVNLLNGLTLQFGQTDLANAGYSLYQQRTKTDASVTDTITRAISIKSINYSLNIANSNVDRNEILARPTLVAMNGQSSEFFSGVEVNAAAVGGSNSDGATVEIDKEIGVKLTLTPEFLEDGRIMLDVTAERTFLTTPNTNSVTFTLRIDTSKTNVHANVVMNYGETLILSGLSEKETERTRDGVPLLQDIPGVQYLFSKKTTRDFQKSVLILLTPRPANYVYQSVAGKKQTRKRPRRLGTGAQRIAGALQRLVQALPQLGVRCFHHMQAKQSVSRIPHRRRADGKLGDTGNP